VQVVWGTRQCIKDAWSPEKPNPFQLELMQAIDASGNDMGVPHNLHSELWKQVKQKSDSSSLLRFVVVVQKWFTALLTRSEMGWMCFSSCTAPTSYSCPSIPGAFWNSGFRSQKWSGVRSNPELECCPERGSIESSMKLDLWSDKGFPEVGQGSCRESRWSSSQ